MKKILLALLALGMVAFMAVNVHAEPRTYTLYLGKTDTGNTTTNVSGVSVLIVQAAGYKRTDGITDITGLEHLEDGTAIFQVSWVTINQVAQAIISGTTPHSTGATFTVRYRERLSNDVDWSLTTPITILSAMALSGNSLYQLPIDPEAMGEIRFEFISGATEFDGAKFKFRILK